MSMSKGIDYGMGETNIDKANGIRFGVIGMNSEHLTEFAWEGIEPDYGEPHCPKCGNEADDVGAEDAPDFDTANWCSECRHHHGDSTADDNPPAKCEQCECVNQDLVCWEEGRGCRDYYCESCRYVFDSSDACGEEPVGHTLDDGEYKGAVDSSNDLFIVASPYYTRAQFCSPCAPGACHLDHPMPEGDKCYCLGHEWFRGGLAPYPVFSVGSDALVMPEWEFKFTGPDDERHLRTWAADGFVLEMYSTNKTDDRGQTVIAYRLTDRGEVIFQEHDFCGSPMHADDSDQSVAALLGFLSLKPGDTDREYFDKYTPRQKEWCRERGEELGMHAHDLEEGPRTGMENEDDE
jgi:hypothetical protein